LIVDPNEIRPEVDARNFASMPRRWLYRLEQSFNFSGQRGGAYCEPEGPQDSVVLPVSVSRRQPVRSMKLCGPLQEFKSMGRRLDPGNRGGVAEANAVNVDINITPRSLRLGRALRHSSTHAAYLVSGQQPLLGGAGWPVSFSRFGAAGKYPSRVKLKSSVGAHLHSAQTKKKG
jgi:hypothetical protein